MTKPRKPSKTGSRTLCQKQSKLASTDFNIAALEVFPGSEAAHLKPAWVSMFLVVHSAGTEGKLHQGASLNTKLHSLPFTSTVYIRNITLNPIHIYIFTSLKSVLEVKRQVGVMNCF